VNPTVRRAPIVFETSLPADVQWLPGVRQLAWDHLGQWGVDSDVIADAVLIADELFTNAVQHGSVSDQDEVAFSLTLDGGETRISVTDTSRRLPQRRQPVPDDENGRGLCLVEALAVRWGVEPAVDGKRIWAVLATPVPQPPSPGQSLRTKAEMRAAA
jgi:serine/threonine-protein kinase RsbW